MILKCFSVLDGAVGAYMAPFFMRSVGEAERWFTDAANDQTSSICKHPEDFELFQVGEFDDSGQLTGITPIKVASALALKEEIPNG